MAQALGQPWKTGVSMGGVGRAVNTVNPLLQTDKNSCAPLTARGLRAEADAKEQGHARVVGLEGRLKIDVVQVDN